MTAVRIDPLPRARARLARPALGVVAAAAVLAGAWGWHAWSGEGAAPLPGRMGREAPRITWRQAEAAPVAARHFVTGLERLPASLRDVQVPDGLQVDGRGQLVVNEALRRVFDHFLSAQGEEPPADTVARLRAYLAARLPSPAADQAQSVLSAYLAYLDALRELPAAHAPADARRDLTDLGARLAQVRALRARFLDAATVHAFFDDEDALADFGLARMAVLRDTTLSPQDRADRLRLARERLSPSQREQMDVVSQVEDLQAATEAWRARGGDAAELHALRQAMVGEEATVRLEALDQSRAAWRARVDQFHQAREALMADPSLSAPQREARVRALVARDFTPAEALHLPGLP